MQSRADQEYQDALKVAGASGWEAAMRRLEYAAVLGSSQAMAKLGHLQWRRDPAAARHWLEQAADLGNADAMFDLGMLIRELDDSDLLAARGWLEKAADQGNTDAMLSLGTILLD